MNNKSTNFNQWFYSMKEYVSPEDYLFMACSFGFFNLSFGNIVVFKNNDQNSLHIHTIDKNKHFFNETKNSIIIKIINENPF